MSGRGNRYKKGKLMRYILIFMVLFTTVFAKGLIMPTYIYKVPSGLVTDIVYKDFKLYAASDGGEVKIFDTKNKQEIQTIKLDKIKDFMGDVIKSKIFSIDLLDDTLLILSQDNGGYSRVHTFENGKLNLIITQEDKFNIIKAKFINKENILIALISNDIISYNLKTKKINWTVQASMSKFSSFALNNDKSEVAIADESGDVHIIATKNGKKIKTLSGENVDNVFSIDFKKNVVLTGGQDRRAGVYNLKNKTAYYQTTDFFIYGVGLSPSGNIGAYSSDVNNDVNVFDTSTRELLGRYKATKMVVNSIYFINEKEFFINSSSHSIGYYKIQ